MNYESKTYNNYQYDSGNKYRKELIMAKVIISELQDTIEKLNQEKKELKEKLEENLNTIKIINSEYISMTQKFNETKEKQIVKKMIMKIK